MATQIQLTPAQKLVYLATGGNACPRCTSGDISAQADVEFDGGFCHQTIDCNQCGLTWDDVYKLAEIDSVRAADVAKVDAPVDFGQELG